MSKTAKFWLITAACLILSGCALFACVMAVLGWDFTALQSNPNELYSHKINEPITSVRIQTDTADVRILPSGGPEASVQCLEPSNLRHRVRMEGGTLVIELEDNRAWYEHISIGFGSPQVNVYLPRGAYESLTVESDTGDVDISEDFSFTSMDISEDTGDVTFAASVSGAVRIRTDTGRIELKGITAGSLELKTSTGDVTVTNSTCAGDIAVTVTTGDTKLTAVTCQSLTTKGSTGDLTLNGVVADEYFSVERSTGDVEFNRCDAAEITVITDTGDVLGSLLTDKIFTVDTDTGRKDVPQSVSGGPCRITTDTGNIRIAVSGTGDSAP
jgi:DUF4097 and DUF4098 domain-containing protein YvlB